MISDRIIENIQSIEANKDGSLVIVKYGADNNSPLFEIFDIGKKVWTIFENISVLTFLRMAIRSLIWKKRPVIQ